MVFTVRHGTGVDQQRRLHHGGSENLVGSGEIAEPSRKVHRLPDVVIALEQDDVPGGHTGSER